MAKREMPAPANSAGGPQKTKTAANALITTVAVIVSLIGINIVGARLFARADLTEDHIYKLSKVSLDTVKNLPDRLNVKAFLSSDLKPPLNTSANYVRDILDEYAAASGGKLVWEAIDPTSGKDADEKGKHKEELTKYKIQNITLESLKESKLEIGSDNYLGIGFAYGDQIESIPSVTQTEGLEYQITGIIRRMVAAKKKKIGFTSSEGELSQQQGLQILSQVLQDYEVVPTTLDKPIADDIDAVVVPGPKQPFSEKAKFYLDQFLMKGKPVALFIDGMVIEAPRGMNMPGMEQPKIGRGNDVGMQELLEKYGVRVRDDLLLDRQNAIGLVPVNGQQRPANYPTFVQLKEEQLEKSDLTSKVKALVVPFGSSVELTGDLKEGKGDVKATAVGKTSHASWRNSGFFLFNPTVPLQQPQTDADRGPFAIGYALEGKFKTAYPNGEPTGTPGAPAPESSPDAASTGALKESPANGRLLVMGCSGLLSDEYLRLSQYVPAYSQDMLFAVNTMDWLLRDDSLISLRAKGATQRPFTLVTESKMMFWRYFIEIGVSLGLIAFGLLMWFLRTARRESSNLTS